MNAQCLHFLQPSGTVGSTFKDILRSASFVQVAQGFRPLHSTCHFHLEGLSCAISVHIQLSVNYTTVSEMNKEDMQAPVFQTSVR